MQDGCFNLIELSNYDLMLIVIIVTALSVRYLRRRQTPWIFTIVRFEQSPVRLSVQRRVAAGIVLSLGTFVVPCSFVIIALDMKLISKIVGLLCIIGFGHSTYSGLKYFNIVTRGDRDIKT